jgi:formate dehydrogenase alpha subunit
VEDEKSGRLMAACVTPAAQDMQIQTHSPRVQKHRRNIVRLMIAEHPESCIVCNKGNRCQLRGIAAQLGVGETGLYPMPNYKPLEQNNPFIVRDLSKCILCGKCIRADHELVCAGAIDYHLRGFKTRPATLYDLPLEHSNCTFCGTCVSMCPTGALSTKRDYVSTPEKTTPSICGFCGAGCNLILGTSGNQVVHISPAQNRKSVNGATLCVRGHFAMDFLSAEERLKTPRRRKEDELAPISWEEALDHVAQELTRIKTTFGSESIAFLGSSKCTNEENYLFQKIARTLLKTNNIDNGGYLSGRQMLTIVDKRTDMGGRFNFFAGPLSGLEKAEAIFVIGADPCHSVPVLSYTLKRSAAKGIPILVADPRKTDLSKDARITLRPNPGSDLELINALSAILCKHEAYDTSFIKRFTRGFHGYKSAMAQMDLDHAVGVTGLDKDTLETAATLLSKKKISFVVGNGIGNQPHAGKIMDALLNLAMMTGSIGYAGAGFYILAKENNLVGAWDMGTVPDTLPGRRPLGDDAAQKEWESVWDSEIPTEPGLNLLQMIEAAERDELKALYIMGENPIRSLPEPDRIRRALKKVDLLIVQDILQTETTAIADIVLPGASFAEKHGTFTNMEGRLQTISPAVSPPGGARSDFDILARIAQKIEGTDSIYTVPIAQAEIGQVLPMYSEPRQSSHLVWLKDPQPQKNTQADKADTPILFSPVHHQEEDQPPEEFPFIALFGSRRYHLGSGTRTSRSKRIRSLGAGGEIDIAATTAENLSLKDDDAVNLISSTGRIVRKVRIQKDLSEDLIFVPGGYLANDARRLLPLTPLFSDQSAGWNCCRVKLEKKE